MGHGIETVNEPTDQATNPTHPIPPRPPSPYPTLQPPSGFLASENLVISEPLFMKPTLPSRASGTCCESPLKWSQLPCKPSHQVVLQVRYFPMRFQGATWCHHDFTIVTGLEDAILGLSRHEAALAAGARLDQLKSLPWSSENVRADCVSLC